MKPTQSKTSAHQQNQLEKEGNKTDYPHANEIQSYATSEGDSEDEFHDCEEVDSDTQVTNLYFCLADTRDSLCLTFFTYILSHINDPSANKYRSHAISIWTSSLQQKKKKAQKNNAT